MVTHLPQVAAWAGVQVGISKREADGSTVTEARVLVGEEREIELARMLGSPDSATARRHVARAAGRFSWV